MIDLNRACFNFSSAIKELDEYLKSELPGFEINIISQDEHHFDSDMPACRCQIIHQTTRLRFCIRVYYGNKIDFRSWGLDGIFWAIGYGTPFSDPSCSTDFVCRNNEYIIFEEGFVPFNDIPIQSNTINMVIFLAILLKRIWI